MTLPRLRLAALAVAVSLPATAVLTPASAAKPVPVVKPRTLYLSGAQTDAVGAAPGGSAASFTTAKPTGREDAWQVVDAFGSGDPGGPLTASWSAPFKGTLTGDLKLRWYWKSVNAVGQTLGIALDVRVWSDPGTPSEKLIGESLVDVAGALKGTWETSTVTLKDARVGSTLGVTVAGHYSDTGHDVRVYYGSFVHPSTVTLPVVQPARR